MGQEEASWKEDFKKAGPGERRKLWRQRGELGKLHNLVAHVMNSSKRMDLFTALQIDANIGKAAGKKWKLIVDGGIRQNSIYLMIRRTLELKEALNQYANDLRDETNEPDRKLIPKITSQPLNGKLLQL